MKGLSRQRLRCRQAEEPFGRRKRDFYIFKGIFFLRKENPFGKERCFLSTVKNTLLRSKSTENQNKIKQQKWFYRFCFIFYGGA